MAGYTAAYPRPDHFILHLSDTHLLAGGRRLYDSVDSEARLVELFARLEASGARPEAIVFTGDLADHGEPEAYVRLRSIVEPAAERLGAQVIWVMGNHDDRGAFRRELLDQLPSMRPIDRVHDINGLRIITLDSTVPGHHHGEVTESQLDWLAEELASPAPHGTILAMHHPPVPTVQDLAVLVELRSQSALAEVVRGSDIRSIIAGHLHYSTTATFAGIPVSVASATCYTQDLAGEVGSTMPRDGAQSYNLIHVYDETVLHTVVPVAATPTLSYTSAAQTARILAEHGVSIRPAANGHVRPEPPLTTQQLELVTT
ncbi:phosphodiesterase [Salinibacterium sp. SYSU T00001]|uniref:phosphodiesterase n=1 Tax=Homoserinimonas sedimenticola TaxID=2986805 RepID=UPI0022365DB7|nr:phosphodiesterase [Salinibacterium sedimenticola]MCW4386197.1 phosphodiesterase [Salinibacterium sedimenticola]